MNQPVSTNAEPSLPLKTRLGVMSDRTRALLDYYFEKECQQFFDHVADQDDADVIIVDYDHPGARTALAQGQYQARLPLLLLSFSETAVAGAIVLGKPFNKHQLQQAALSLLEPPSAGDDVTDLAGSSNKASDKTGEAGGNNKASDKTRADDATHTMPDGSTPESNASEGVVTDAPSPDKVAAPSGEEATTADSALRPETLEAGKSETDTRERQRRQETKVTLLCGPPRSLEELESDDPEHRFSPARHLSGHLQRAQGRCDGTGIIAVQMTLPTMEIYVLHWLQKVMTSASLKSSRNVGRAFRAFDDDEITMTDYRSDTVNTLVNRVNGTSKFSFSTEAFVWLCALFSARGRLPEGVDLDQTWRLNQWPNLTRLEPVPQCVETASAWSREPASLRQIILSTDHEPRHVTAFFNGALALGLIEPDNADAETVATTDASEKRAADDAVANSQTTDTHSPERG